MELTKSALLAALEGLILFNIFKTGVELFLLCDRLRRVNFFSPLLAALSPGSLFGLATFSHKIGLYDVQGPVPVVKNVFIPPDAESKLPLELEDAMPLLQFLAPVL